MLCGDGRITCHLAFAERRAWTTGMPYLAATYCVFYSNGAVWAYEQKAKSTTHTGRSVCR